jgi:hypothetical protein
MPFGAIAQSPASPAAMMASISASGGQILYSGAIPTASGVGIAVDVVGNAYIAGNAGGTLASAESIQIEIQLQVRMALDLQRARTG